VALAIAAAAELACNHGFPVTPAALVEGIRKTRWPGRLERIEREGVEWILDVAHNPAGAWALRDGLGAVLAGAAGEGRPRTLIFSCLRDKPIAEIAQILFPLFDQVILAPIQTARAAAQDALLAAAEATGVRALATESVGQAMQLAIEQARQCAQPSVIVVSGSVYLVGEARTLLLPESGAQS
jgi:dihydrofolate synthase/folylpolyglutamate synthase